MERRWRFDNGKGGFDYDDDLFRMTHEPFYAVGRHTGSALMVRLGGRDHDPVKGMSGGWTRGFELDEAATVTLTFKAKIKLGPDTREKDFTDIRMLFDGEPVDFGKSAYAARVHGDGPGGGWSGMGWRTFEIELGPKAAGRHDFTLGGFSNFKKSSDAVSKIWFDDVRLSAKAPDAPDLGRFEAEVLERTNAFREKHGLDPVEADARLMEAAEGWSREMARGDFFRHSQVADELEEVGYDAAGYGENIAAGYRTPKEVVQGWIDSPGHRKNLLREDFEHIGIGHYEKSNDGGDAPYGHYWTQVFGAPSDDYLF